MNKTNILLASVGVVALLLGVLALAKPAQVIIDRANIGAIPGNSVDSPEFTQAGHTSYKVRQPVNAATSTTAGIVCSIKSPSATSTMTYGQFALTTGTTTATVATLAKAATPYATTTVLNAQILNANDTIHLMASTSPTTPNGSLAIVGRMVFAPNQYFNVGLQGGSGAASTYTGAQGACNAIFEVN